MNPFFAIYPLEQNGHSYYLSGEKRGFSYSNQGTLYRAVNHLNMIVMSMHVMYISFYLFNTYLHKHSKYLYQSVLNQIISWHFLDAWNFTMFHAPCSCTLCKQKQINSYEMFVYFLMSVIRIFVFVMDSRYRN